MRLDKATWMQLAFALFLAGVLAAACGGGAQPTPPASTPVDTPSAATAAPEALDAAALLAERCVQCHSLDRVKAAHMDEAGWQATVTRMRRLGAQLSETELDALVKHLAQVQGE